MEKTMKYLARVNPKYFAAIHQCAAKGDVRYYLNAVQIEPHAAGGVLIVATNGHFMGAIHDPDGWIHPEHKSVLIGTVSKRMLSACAARKGPDGEPPALLWIAEKFSLITSLNDVSEEPELFGKFSHLTEKTELVDGVFPNWRRVIPKKRLQFEGTYPCFNGEYLEVFNKIGVMLSGQKRYGGGGMHLETGEENGSVIVRFNRVDLTELFVGVLMPMRGDELKGFLPAWTKAETESEAA